SEKSISRVRCARTGQRSCSQECIHDPRSQSWNARLLDWPAESPDLNPIELVWGNMKAFIRKRNIRTVEELRKAVLVCWKTRTPEVCTRYISGVYKRLHRVVEQEGRNIL
ncbi:hypothetical protein OSTOST_25445, partial [Ostertagia ostertagi]